VGVEKYRGLPLLEFRLSVCGAWFRRRWNRSSLS